MTNIQGTWLTIVDYASLKRVSISTVRRYIKSNRLKHKFEDGRYYIYVSDLSKRVVLDPAENREVLRLKLEVERLKSALKQKDEELCELKMLVMLYEGNKNGPSKETINPPELPV